MRYFLSLLYISSSIVGICGSKMSKIEVISSSLVGMSTDAAAAASVSKLELNPLDLQLLLIDPIQRAIFFHNPLPQPQNFISHLKNSLSRALDFFPPLAGRLATTAYDDGTTSFHVDCNNAGTQFTHAVAADISLSDILDPHYIPEIVSSFFVMNGIPNYEGVSKPLMGVQVTELEDGLVIAFTANHAVADGVSFWHFVNSWSEISRGLDSISKPPVFHRWFPNGDSSSTPIRFPPLEKDLQRSSVPPPLPVRVFHFSKEILAKLKAKANTEAGTDKISSLQALSAHLWRSSARCRGLSPTGEVRFSMVVGVRERIPLPDGYFGNALYGSGTTMSVGELLQRGLGNAALKIHDFVAAQTKEVAIKLVEDWMKNPTFVRKMSSSIAIGSSHRHNVYGNDFGWGKPVAVRSGASQVFDGKVAVFPSAEDGGIYAEVSMTPEVLQAMECDAEFMEAFIV